MRTAIFALNLVAAMLISTPTLANDTDPTSREEDELLSLYGDVDMISIATGNLQSITKAPAVASVINAEDIKALGADDLDQVLETIPGLHVTPSALGYNPIYVFRGIHSEYNPQVLLLINGIPISNLFHGDRGLIWGGMPVQAIKRIEVIRGPGSALYGADAFAGVINIITLSGEDIRENEVGLTLGSYQSRGVWGRFATRWHDFSLAAVIEYNQTDGQDSQIAYDQQSTLDMLSGTAVSHAPGPVSLSRENLDIRIDVSSGKWQFRSGLQHRSDWGNGAGVAGALDPDNRWKSDRFNMDLTYHDAQFTRYWDIQGQLSYLDTTTEAENNMRIFPAGADLTLIGFGGVYPDGLIGNPESFERHYRGNFTANYSGFDGHQLRTGIGYTFSDLYKVRESKNFGPDPDTGALLPPGGPVVDVSDTPYVYLREGDRSNAYLYLQDVWALANDWDLTAGLRYDHYNDFGSTLNPRLALVWSSSRRLTTKLLYGKAFRAPSFAETNAINNPVVLGNPDVDPERLTSYELAFDYRATQDLRLALNLFAYNWDDIIKFTPDAGANSKSAKNIGQQKGVGSEIELIWQARQSLKLSANYAWQNARDQLTQTRTSLVPRHQFFTAADWQMSDNLSLHGQLNWVADRSREVSDLRPDIDNYVWLETSIDYTNSEHNLAASVGIRNLTDTDAREPSAWSSPAAAIPGDLPLAGRNLVARVSLRF